MSVLRLSEMHFGFNLATTTEQYGFTNTICNLNEMIKEI